jgi:hypothetical protein
MQGAQSLFAPPPPRALQSELQMYLQTLKHQKRNFEAERALQLEFNKLPYNTMDVAQSAANNIMNEQDAANIKVQQYEIAFNEYLRKLKVNRKDWWGNKTVKHDPYHVTELVHNYKQAVDKYNQVRDEPYPAKDFKALITAHIEKLKKEAEDYTGPV